MPRLSEAQAAAAQRLTLGYKARENREAARLAALIALYYANRVNVEDPASVEEWLELMVPRLIRASDSSADRSAAFYTALRQLELGRADFTAEPARGYIDEGVRRSLIAVGPGKYLNKAAEVRRMDLEPAQARAVLAEAKQVTVKEVAGAAIRHAQAGGRQTIHQNSERDRTALGWIRVTKATPCYFCAMLASRGIHYRAFKEGAFAESDARFTGSGDAKVHDNCGCSLKPVFSENDPILKRNQGFVDLWERFGAGGGDAIVRFRRGYEHWVDTGEYLDWDVANKGLRAA